MIAFAPTNVSGVWGVPDAGGASQPLTHIGMGEASHRWPEFLPDGKALLFAAGTNYVNWSNAQVAVQPVGTDERRILIQGATHPRFALSGHLIYAQAGRLMAVPFDPPRAMMPSNFPFRKRSSESLIAPSIINFWAGRRSH